jgi:hypothetical protein
MALNIAQELTSIDPLIYEAVKTPDYLPTETEREYTARQKRYEQIGLDFAAGKIATVNDLITYNLDIRTFADDWLSRLDAPTMLRRFYAALTELTVLDPTCGSGAFLFAAMNILEPLYEGCLRNMEIFVARSDGHAFSDFQTELDRVRAHPNERYFIFKSIIVNNLYGVDIMDEAVEICKLRLFLKLVAQVSDVRRIEPLPDIDFNIRAGNTLVGFATEAEINADMFAHITLPKIKTTAGTLRTFRQQQLQTGIAPATMKTLKKNVREKQGEIAVTLDKALMDQYGQTNLDSFRASHKPFHWYAEYNGVMADGGFDVIVGNPPYVEYGKIRDEYTIRDYVTLTCNNLWAYTVERARTILHDRGRFGLIVPMSLVCADRMQPVQKLLESRGIKWISNYESDSNPGQLFDGVKQNVSILIYLSLDDKYCFTTRQHRFFANARDYVFSAVEYVQSERDYIGYGFSKVGQKIEIAILDKIFRHKSLGHQMSKNGKPIYVHRIAHYYIKCFNFVPYFRSDRDGLKKSEDYKEYLFPTPIEPYIAAINSSIFYFYWQVFFDSFKAGKFCIETFPIMPFTDAQAKELSILATNLMSDMKSNSKRLAAHYAKTGNVEYDQFFPRFSKPIIDEIDLVLAQHYGFSDEELDFIINYDIKYRMGRDAESEDEGGE